MSDRGGSRRDPWARWLLERRPPTPELGEFRDGVLDRAGIREGDVVLDVGCGDGLIALGALQRVGPAGRVVFSDISSETLGHCRALATGDGRCAFVQTGLPDLAVASGSVDVATLRSVLIYVKEKAESFRELHRVLRPGGGRLSMFEPINSFGSPAPDHLFAGYDVTGLEPLAAKVKAVFSGSAVSSMVDFDERDLLTLAEKAGFTDIRLDYRAEVGTELGPINWDVPPNPLAPSLAEAFEQVLTPAEGEALRARLVGPRRKRFATAYLSARRPG